MTIQLSNKTVLAAGPSPPLTDVTAGYQLGADGNIYSNILKNGVATNTDIGDWLSTKTGMSSYESMFTVLTGTITSGTTGVWQGQGSQRSFAKQTTLHGSQTATVQVQVREIANHANIASCVITLTDLMSP